MRRCQKREKKEVVGGCIIQMLLKMDPHLQYVSTAKMDSKFILLHFIGRILIHFVVLYSKKYKVSATSNSTGNMKRHILKHHPEKVIEEVGLRQEFVNF